MKLTGAYYTCIPDIAAAVAAELSAAKKTGGCSSTPVFTSKYTLEFFSPLFRTPIQISSQTGVHLKGFFWCKISSENGGTRPSLAGASGLGRGGEPQGLQSVPAV